jgi:hypothetical protein
LRPVEDPTFTWRRRNMQIYSVQDCGSFARGCVKVGDKGAGEIQA